MLKNNNYLPSFSFVTFWAVADREALLKDYSPAPKCCKSLMRDSEEEPNRVEEERLLYKGQALQFSQCEMEPDGIIWENLNVSRRELVVRFIIVLLLLLLFLFVAVAIMFVFAAS